MDPSRVPAGHSRLVSGRTEQQEGRVRVILLIRGLSKKRALGKDWQDWQDRRQARLLTLHHLLISLVRPPFPLTSRANRHKSMSP